MDKKIIETVQEWLDAQGVHFSSHNTGEENSYAYLNSNGYDYSDHLSGPESVETAFNEGWISLEADGIRFNMPPYHTIPIVFDTVKIRRRVEDALRKTTDTQMLLKFAAMLDVKLI